VLCSPFLSSVLCVLMLDCADTRFLVFHGLFPILNSKRIFLA
jgi:hypothetical protein